LAHNHGNPTLPVYYIYHNTFLLPGKPEGNFYAHTWSSHVGGTTRRVFNNIFVQLEGLPGLNVRSLTPDHDFQADANLYWSVKDGLNQGENYFAKLHASDLFVASKKQYPPGWGSKDLFADPRFVGATENPDRFDARLQRGSPAIDAGVILPAAWPDPLREQEEGKPDLGALPLGLERFTFGVRSHSKPPDG
jgi:hypothetical protein